ncbi:MAG: CHASE2 domain-containing protein [Prosthecobacter sp.]|nr:CHASE2 domain-containing protein [Prosthecobacter sp.]
MRLIFSLLCLAGTVWFLMGEQKAGSFQKVDDAVLDFLVENARWKFEKTVTPGEVVLIEMREDERDEYASWPPPPLDWQSLLKNLHQYHPSVVVITNPLNWGHPTPEFGASVSEALLPFPSVVLGIEAELADASYTAPAFLADLESVLPRFQLVDGGLASVPKLAALVTAPDTVVRGSSELGPFCLRKVQGHWRLPYAVNARDSLIPTVLAQTLARYSLSSYAAGQRLRLGLDAGAYLQGGIYIPLEPTGEYIVQDEDKVPTLNALNLMMGGLADAMTESDQDRLNNARIIVVGTTSKDQSAPAELYARALNHLLALPKIRTFSPLQQWATWGIAALLALGLATKLRQKTALKVGLFLIFGALITGFGLFLAELIWTPPTIPLALLLVGTLLGRFLGEKAPMIPQTDESVTNTEDMFDLTAPKTAPKSTANSAVKPDSTAPAMDGTEEVSKQKTELSEQGETKKTEQPPTQTTESPKNELCPKNKPNLGKEEPSKGTSKPEKDFSQEGPGI